MVSERLSFLKKSTQDSTDAGASKRSFKLSLTKRSSKPSLKDVVKRDTFKIQIEKLKFKNRETWNVVG